jgi:DNA topoisomerase IA
MTWLILTENQEKASRLREVLRSNLEQDHGVEITLISSRGLPWTVEVEISSNELAYKVKEKQSYQSTLKRIDDVAESCDRILLAFEPTSIGEATAWEFEKRLGAKKCARYKTYQLDKKSIVDTIITLEGMDWKGLPKSNINMAKSHWVQAVIDLTWASKVNELLFHIPMMPKVTRLMGIILKSIATEQRKQRKHKTQNHWEIELELKACGTSSTSTLTQTKKENKPTIASVIVPTLAQIGKGVGPKAREFWRAKLEQSKEEALQGLGSPQPEPGKPWRFPHIEEAKILKQHIKKFPYFLVESKCHSYTANPIRCPHTNNSIHELFSIEKSYLPEIVEKSLQSLYTKGLISNFKSNFPSLSAPTIQEMQNYWKPRGLNLSKEFRVFHAEEEQVNQLEALHPIHWEIEPKNTLRLLNSTPNVKKEEVKLETRIYTEIYNACVESQREESKTKIEKNFLSGPLFLSRRQTQEHDGRSFHVKKEEPFHAHMTVLLMTKLETTVKEGEIMECITAHIKEHQSLPPKPMTKSSLVNTLCLQGAGKRETIINILNFLEEKKIIPPTEKINLTPQGEKILNILEENFGQYLDINYLKTLTGSIQEIQRGVKQEADFLNSWWYSLRSFLSSHNTEEKILAWKKKNS